MERETSDSEIKKLLDEIAITYNCKIWVARKIGRRWAYIDGLKAGKELFLPAELIYEHDNIGVFVEGLEISQKDMVVKRLDDYFRGREEVAGELCDTRKNKG